jgi:hypothetical protein
LIQYVTIKKFLLTVFFILIVLAVCSVVILHMTGIAIALLPIDFIVAGFVAIFEVYVCGRRKKRNFSNSSMRFNEYG